MELQSVAYFRKPKSTLDIFIPAALKARKYFKCRSPWPQKVLQRVELLKNFSANSVS